MIKQLFEIGVADLRDPVCLSYIRSIESRFEECFKKAADRGSGATRR